MSTEGHVFTIGYQGVSLSRVLDSLEAAAITLVVDTRETPMSRRPDFRRRRLADELSRRGIAYLGMPTLGAPRELRSQVADWSTFAARYRAKIAEEVEAIAAVAHLVRGERVCLLCFEDDPAACHRSILVEELQSHLRALTVLHLRPGRVDETDNREGVGMSLHGAHDQL